MPPFDAPLFNRMLRTASAAPRPPHRKKFLFESLESRLLLSADLAPAAQAALSSGLQELKAWSDTLVQYNDLAKALPVVNTTIGQALDLGNLIQSKIVTPAQTYLSGGGTKTTDGLVAALQGALGAGNITGDQFGNEIRFDVNLDSNKVLNGVPFNIGATPSGLPITGDANAKINLGVGLDFNFSFGFDLSEGISQQEAFFVRVQNLKTTANVQQTGLNFGASVGFLQAQVQNGSVGMDAEIDVALNNPDHDAQGNVTMSEMLGTTLDDLVTLTKPVANLTANLPVAAQALGSFAGGQATVTVSGNPFSTPTVGVTGSLAADFENFGRISPDAVLKAFQQIGGWLDGLRQTTAFADGLPLTNNEQFSQVLDLAKAFSDGVTSQFKDGQGNFTFASAQQLSARLSALLGIPESAIAANYNSGTNQLTYFLKLEKPLAGVSVPINFSLNLSPLSSIVTTSQIDISATGRVQFTLGFDLSPYSATYLGDKVLPANGQLSADAVFSVGLDGANPTQVTVAHKTTNTTRTQLVNDINAAFTAAGLTGITASVDGSGKLTLTHVGTLLGARIDLIAPNPATNTAVTELGLKLSVSASDNLLTRAFLRDVRAGGTVNLSASDIDATANFGFFGVGINNGSATASGVLDVQVRNPSNTSGPILLSQLFDANNSIATWGVVTRWAL